MADLEKGWKIEKLHGSPQVPRPFKNLKKNQGRFYIYALISLFMFSWVHKAHVA